MSDKDFKVKNKLQVKGITSAGPVISDSVGNLDSTPYIATQYGGTGTSTSPTSGQILYSASGSTYAPTTLTSLDVKGATYSADAPASPFVGQVWIESDSSSDSFDPNIMRRKTITATAGQTVFTTDFTFIDGYEQVYFNGMLLLRTTDYTTSGSSSTVTLTSAAAVNDIVEIVTITNLNSINAATTTTNTFTGQQTIQGNLVVGGSIPNLSSSTKAITVDSSSASDYAALEIATGGTLRGYLNATNGAMYIAAVGSNPLVTYTNGSERMRIDSSGNIGVGTSSPATAFLDPSGNNVTAKLIDVQPGNNTYGGIVVGTARTYANNTTNRQGYFVRRADGWNTSRTGMWKGSDALSSNLEYWERLIFNNDGGDASISFATNLNERMRITSDGNVGIGVTNPGYKLHVEASGTNYILSRNSAAGSGIAGFICQNSGDTRGMHINGSTLHLYDYSAGAARLSIDGSGNVLIGYASSNGSYKLQVNSQIFATSSTIATSDGRYKDNVSTIDSGLNIIDSLRPVSFTWKEHAVHNFPEGKTIGFIAQEVQEALADYDWVDNLIKTNINEETQEEFLGIAEGNLIPLLVAAVKELKSRVETLEAANV